jgi:DNA replication protein
MSTFDGFQHSKDRQVKIPATFFSDLLPLIDDLAELKVVLFAMWALPQKESGARYLRPGDFANDSALMTGLQATQPDTAPDEILAQALNQSVARGALLRIEKQGEPLYFMNSPAGRSAVADLEAGRWLPGDAHNPVEILPERPNIFQLYEANIGSITPMLAEELKDAAAEFPAAWLEEAMRLAVEHNKRSWRYVRAILDRWHREGKDRGFTAESDQQSGEKYVSGKYAAFIDNTRREE